MNVNQNVNETATARNSGVNRASREMRADTAIATQSASNGKVHGKFEPFKPRGAQTIPEELSRLMESNGYSLRWVRCFSEGKLDTENLAEAAHRGYSVVDVSEVPANIAKTLQVSDVGGFKGVIVSKDTALFKIPTERAEEIRKYFEDIANAQVEGVNQMLMQNKSGAKVFNESKSEVLLGENSRKVVFQGSEG